MRCSIAICDDDPRDRDYLEELVCRWTMRTGQPVRISRFSSAEQFLFYYEEHKDVQILLLDIEMGAMDGVSLAKKLRGAEDPAQIVFITGYPDFLAEGYEVGAVHYLLKPVKEEKLCSVLDRAVKAVAKRERTILLSVGGSVVRLPVKKIQYVEAFAHSVSIVTDGDTIQVKLPISQLEQSLGEDFVRCHRSYLVGLRHIARLSRTEVTLDSGTVLPLSRSAAPTVHKVFISYYTGDNDETI